MYLFLPLMMTQANCWWLFHIMCLSLFGSHRLLFDVQLSRVVSNDTGEAASGPHSAVEILCVSDQQVLHYRLSLRIRQGQLDPVDVHLQGLALYSICKRLTSQVRYATMFQTTKILFCIFFTNYWHSNQICQNRNLKNIKASKKQKRLK